MALREFEFTHEVEGGYTVYRVEVPTDSGTVEIRAEPDGAEVATSFDLQHATIVRKGNVHFDAD